MPGAIGAGVNFGVTAARALEDGKIDGFWANSLGAEVAVRGGFGTVVLDVRGGDGAAAFTMASIAASEQAPGSTTWSRAATMASSTRNPPKAMQRGSPLSS